MPKTARRIIRRAILSAGKAEKAEGRMTAMEKVARLETGVSKKELEMLKRRTGLDYEKLARLLSVTRPTLINKTGSGKFPLALSERILSLADLYSYGYEVFEDEDRFNQWMFKPNHGLGGRTPFDLCNNQFGREEVRSLVGRIDYGVYS